MDNTGWKEVLRSYFKIGLRESHISAHLKKKSIIFIGRKLWKGTSVHFWQQNLAILYRVIPRNALRGEESETHGKKNFISCLCELMPIELTGCWVTDSASPWLAPMKWVVKMQCVGTDFLTSYPFVWIVTNKNVGDVRYRSFFFAPIKMTWNYMHQK